MSTPREKSPLPEKILLGGGSNPHGIYIKKKSHMQKSRVSDAPLSYLLPFCFCRGKKGENEREEDKEDDDKEGLGGGAISSPNCTRIQTKSGHHS